MGLISGEHYMPKDGCLWLALAIIYGQLAQMGLPLSDLCMTLFALVRTEVDWFTGVQSCLSFLFCWSSPKPRLAIADVDKPKPQPRLGLDIGEDSAISSNATATAVSDPELHDQSGSASASATALVDHAMSLSVEQCQVVVVMYVLELFYMLVECDRLAAAAPVATAKKSSEPLGAEIQATTKGSRRKARLGVLSKKPESKKQCGKLLKTSNRFSSLPVYEWNPSTTSTMGRRKDTKRTPLVDTSKNYPADKSSEKKATLVTPKSSTADEATLRFIQGRKRTAPRPRLSDLCAILRKCRRGELLPGFSLAAMAVACASFFVLAVWMMAGHDVGLQAEQVLPSASSKRSSLVVSSVDRAGFGLVAGTLLLLYCRRGMLVLLLRRLLPCLRSALFRLLDAARLTGSAVTALLWTSSAAAWGNLRHGYRKMRKWNVATPATTRSAAIVASASKGVKRDGGAPNVDRAFGRVWGRRIAAAVAVGGSWRLSLCARSLNEPQEGDVKSATDLANSDVDTSEVYWASLKHPGGARLRDTEARCQYLTAHVQGQAQFVSDRGDVLTQGAKPAEKLLQAMEFDDNDWRAYESCIATALKARPKKDPANNFFGGAVRRADSVAVPVRGKEGEGGTAAVLITRKTFRIVIDNAGALESPGAVSNLLNANARATTSGSRDLRHTLQAACVALDVAGSPCCAETYFVWVRWHFQYDVRSDEVRGRSWTEVVVDIFHVRHRPTGTFVNYALGEPPFNTGRPQFENNIRLRAGELFAVRVQQLHDAGYAHLNLKPGSILLIGDPSWDAWWDVKLFGFDFALPVSMAPRLSSGSFFVAGTFGYHDPRLSEILAVSREGVPSAGHKSSVPAASATTGGILQARHCDTFMVGTARIFFLRGEVYIRSRYLTTIQELTESASKPESDGGVNVESMWKQAEIHTGENPDTLIPKTSPLYDLDQYKLRTGRLLLRWEPDDRKLAELVKQDKQAALRRLLVGETLTQGQDQSWKRVGLSSVEAEQVGTCLIDGPGFRAQQLEILAVDTSTSTSPSVSALFDRVQQAAKQTEPDQWGCFGGQIFNVLHVEDSSTVFRFPGVVAQEGGARSRASVLLKHIEILPPAPASTAGLEGFMTNLAEVMENPSDAGVWSRMKIPEPAKNALRAALQDTCQLLRDSCWGNTRSAWLKVSDVVGAHLLILFAQELAPEDSEAPLPTACGLSTVAQETPEATEVKVPLPRFAQTRPTPRPPAPPKAALIETNPKDEDGGPHMPSANYAPSLLDVSFLGDVILVHDNSFLETSLTDVVEDPFDEVDQPHVQEPSRLSQSGSSFVSSSSSKGTRTDPVASSSSSSTTGEDTASSATSSDYRARSSTASTLRVVSKHVHDDDGGEEEDATYLSQ
ncbi:unnamed protein product [Amoebophrya sp. A25]|nr:unnamed protein product [Amoebophrya sp. A25]|eukprot:GSA25T00016830001.1